MSRIEVTSDSRVTHDPSSGAIRTWFDPTVEPAAKAPFMPRDLAHQVLQESAELFAWDPTLPDLRDHAVVEGENAYSVRLTQEFKQIPVDSSEVVVNMDADGRVHSIYNNYHYDIPRDLDPEKVEIDAEQARELVERLLQVYENPELGEPELIVYQYGRSENHPPKPPGRPTPHRERFLAAVASHMSETEDRGNRPTEGEYFLAWDMTATTENPSHAWRILVDAMNARLINVIDLFQYATGSAQAFDPNPIVTSGDTTLNASSPIATLNAQRIAVVVDRLDPAVGGNLRLDGTYVKMAEIESPAFAEPISPAGNFSFSSDDRNFLAAMCYFHIDRLQNYCHGHTVSRCVQHPSR